MPGSGGREAILLYGDWAATDNFALTSLAANVLNFHKIRSFLCIEILVNAKGAGTNDIR